LRKVPSGLLHRTDGTDRTDPRLFRQDFGIFAKKTYPPRAGRGGPGGGVLLTERAKKPAVVEDCRGGRL